MNETTGKKKALMAFFSHPVVGILGSIASIIGIALSIYLYLATKESPELTYFVHPVRAAVVRAGQASNISVQFEGKNLASDVTAAQIAIWNDGKKSIHSANILRPLVIRTNGKAKILEARLKKSTRDVTELTLDTSRLAIGEVEVTWNILEQNDGGVIQLIYCGDEKTIIEANAIVEGQSEITQSAYNSFSSLSIGWKLSAFLFFTIASFIISSSLSRCILLRVPFMIENTRIAYRVLNISVFTLLVSLFIFIVYSNIQRNLLFDS